MAYFGLTGGVASGKSTVARMFEEAGARIIDADHIGHELLRSSLPAYQEVVKQFGREILNPSGEVDRRRLGAIVFAERARLDQLNAILHPRIIDRVEELTSAFRAQDSHAVVLVDAALIYEAGIGRGFTKMIVVWCRPEQQVERLIAKAGMTREEAERRIPAQMSAEEKRRRADYVIDTSGTLDETRRQVQALCPQLRRLLDL